MGLQVRVAEAGADRECCLALRRAVFIDEQGVTEREEIDGLDDECVHFLAVGDEVAVGTARLWVTPNGEAKAQRVAVLASHRGQGVGALLMAAVERHAAAAGHPELILAAQESAIPFYQRIGYSAYGEEFLDAQILHRWMRKALE